MIWKWKGKSRSFKCRNAIQMKEEKNWKRLLNVILYKRGVPILQLGLWWTSRCAHKRKVEICNGDKKFPNTKAPLSEWSGSRNNLICVEVSEW